MNEAISPQKLAEEGKKAYQRSDFFAAAHAFEAAGQGFSATGDALSAAEMANNCSVAFLQAGDAPAALLAVEGTPSIFAAAGDTRRQGMALGNWAAALEALNRLDEAADAYCQSAEVLREAKEDAAYVQVMQALSALQLRMGRQIEALATMQAGLENAQRPTSKQRLIKQMLRLPFKFLEGK